MRVTAASARGGPRPGGKQWLHDCSVTEQTLRYGRPPVNMCQRAGGVTSVVGGAVTSARAGPRVRLPSAPPAMFESSLSRRALLLQGAAAAAVAGLPRAAAGHAEARGAGAPAAAPPGEFGPARLGVASYSLRKFPRERAIAMCKALGVSAVNLKSVHAPYELAAAELAAVRREVEAAGLRVVGGGTITFEKDTDEDVGRYFAYARAAGMPIIVATGHPDVLPRVERFAKQTDVRVAIHNHGPEDQHYPSPYDVLKRVRAMDPRMGLCIDVGHTTRAGADPVQAAADAGPRLLDMHVKDLRDLKVKESQCVVGDGAMPVADVFRQLQRMGYAGHVNLEYEIDADDPLPGMQRSFAYMRGVLAGLAPSARPAAASRTPAGR